MGRRQDNKKRNRRALLEASLDLFREVGFDQTRVQDIVDRVGVSPATFFNYFPAKDAVLAEVSLEATRSYIELLDAQLEQRERTAAARLLEVATLVSIVMSEDPAVSTLLATRTGFLTGASDDLADADRQGQHRLAELFAQGQDAAEFHRSHDPLQLAELFSTALAQTSLNYLTEWFGPVSEPLSNRVERAIGIILAGASSPPVAGRDG